MRPLIVGHRGGRQVWPENTLFALEQAAKLGIDAAEIDVQLSRDDALVVFHDFRLSPHLCRDAQGHWLTAEKGRDLPPIRMLSYAELSAFDVGRTKPGTDYGRVHAPLFPHDGERIPLFAEVVETVRRVNPRFRLLIEIKTSDEDRSLSAPPEAVVEAVLAALARLDFKANAMLTCFDWAALIHARKREPDIPRWFLTRQRPDDAPRFWTAGYDPRDFGGSIPKAIAAAGGQGWHCSLDEATPNAIAGAHAQGLQFAVWNVNEEDEMRRFAELGADALCTDRPDRAAGLFR